MVFHDFLVFIVVFCGFPGFLLVFFDFNRLERVIIRLGMLIFPAENLFRWVVFF